MRPALSLGRDFLRLLASSAAAAGGLPFLTAPFPAAAEKPSPNFPFSEILPSTSGINFVHTSGKSPQKYLPESTGPGCAFLDYDNDGWMDIYLVNGGPCDFWTPPTPLRNALYRNNRDGTFTDVTESAGVAASGWASSAVWFDYDNDGRLDLFVCRFVDFTKEKNKFCENSATGDPYYCAPSIYTPMP